MADEVKVTIRIPPALHRALVKLAETENRSLNGEIVDLLQWSSEARVKAKPK